MAVYTKIEKNLLINFLCHYKIGELINFEGIQEGVENSNYKIVTTLGTFILTIFEKRVKANDLPFFIELTKHLVEKNFKCPKPIPDKNGNYINKIKDKACIINSFLNGKKTPNVDNYHCQQLGEQLAIMHLNTQELKISRQNNLSIKYLKKLFESFKNNSNTIYKKIYNEIDKELNFLTESWPTNLPIGIIHADAFQDNVFFENQVFSGIIDFYFACNDFYAYEIAICINAWCFNEKFKIEANKSKTIIESYNKLRNLTESEKKAMPILLRGAAIRFLLTRLNDIIYSEKDAFVKQKDPMEYFYILDFHKKNNSNSFLKI